jgi:hypothetical protein
MRWVVIVAAAMGAGRGRFRGGTGGRDLSEPIVPMAATALCCCTSRCGVFACGGCAGARSDARAAGDARGFDIEFASGARMRLMGPVDASTVKAMVAMLAKAKRG